MTDISDMSLWALAVPAKKACKYEVEQTAEMVQYVHVTNVALGLGHGDGTLTIEKDGKEIVVARLDKDRPQHNLDFILDQTVVFRNHGSLELHLLGYETVSAVMPEGEEPEFGSDDDEDEDEESEEEEDEEPPRAIPISNGKVGQGPMKKAMQPQVVDDGTEDDEDEDDEFELGADDLIMENAGDEGDEGESEDEGDEGEDEDEGEDDEEEDEEEPTPQPQKQAGGKRPAPAAALTPQVTKKAKGADAQPKVPASAPPKQAAGKQQQQPAGKAGATAVKKPANEKEFEKAIVDFLKSKPDKTAPMAQLGSAVHKPDGVPKLGTWIKSRPQLFKVEDNGQKVRLAA